MAITPSTSLQSFTIDKYTAGDSGGTASTCPSSLYLEVQHKITGTSGNKTTLQITLILHHAQINLKAGDNDCYIQVGSVSTSWKGPDLYSTTSGKTTTLGTKSIEVTHTNGLFENQNFIIRYRFNATYSSTSVGYITNNYTNSTQNKITLPALYTACTAPTSVSASGYVTPSGSFTVSWSGAAGGTNNSINGYDVYYRVASSATNPTTSSYTGKTSVSSTATSGSTTITLSSATRGHIVVCGVVTKGTAGSSFYSSIKTGGSVTVNRVPTAPTVTTNISPAVIPSSGSRSFTFTITPGTDADTGQTKTVRYSKTNDTATTAITSGTSITFSEPTTVSFWTYDGLEWSPATTISVTRNTKPVISTFSASVGTFTAFGTSSASGQFQGWADYITPTIKANKTGTITRVVELMRTNSIAKFSVNKSFTYASETLSSTSPTTLAKITPYSAISSQYGATIYSTYKYIGWRIKYTLSDGLETSDPVYYPANTDYFYAIPGMTTVQQKTYLDENNNATNKLYKNVRFKLYNETAPSGTTSLGVLVSATIDGQAVAVTKTADTIDGNYRLVTARLTNAPSSDKEVIFAITYTRSDLAKVTQEIGQVRTIPPSFGTLTVSNATLKPFTSTTPYYFSVAWPFGSYSLSDALTAYNIDSNGIILSLTRNNTSYTVTATASKETNDTLRLTINNGQNFYPWSNAWGVSTYAGKYTYSIQIKATNIYGESSVSSSKDFEVNFNEPISDLKITKFYRVYNTSSLISMYSPSPTSGGTATMDSRGFARGNEGLMALSYSGYTRDTCTVKVYFDGSVIKTFTISNAGKSGNSLYTIIHDTGDDGDFTTTIISSEKFTIPEITKVKTPVKIVVTNNYGSSTFEIAGGMNTVRQTAPTMTLTGLEIDENKFSGRLTISDLGVSSNEQTDPYAVSDGSSLYSGAFSVTGSGSSYTFSEVTRTGTDFDSKSLTLRFTSKVTIYSNSSATGTTTSPKDYYLNYITVYKASPTVAYRKNAIGINTSNPKSGAALDVHNSSTTSNVYFQGLNALWTFDITAGTIQFNSNTALNLSNFVQTVNSVAPVNGNITLSIPTIGTGASNAAAGDHAHGSITNTGAITSNTTIATNDKIVFADNSDSGKLKRASIVFNTNVTNKYLTQAGTWADSLSTTTLTATGAISGASVSATGAITAGGALTTGGTNTLGGHLYLAGNIVFDSGEQTAERYINFKNAANSTYHHNVSIYGGSPSSTTEIGVWDTAHDHGVMYYLNSGLVGIMNTTAAINRGSDVQILGHSINNDFQMRRADLTTEDLNNCDKPGYYIQHVSTNATIARHYPVANYAGFLEVFTSTSYSSRYRLQRFTTYDSRRVYVRDLYGSSDSTATWSDWRSISPVDIKIWDSAAATPDIDTLVSDTNTYLGNGYSVFCALYNANTTTAKHFPVAVSGFLECFYIGARYVQRYTTYNTSAIYMRHYYESTWSAWKKVWPCSATVTASFTSGYAQVDVADIPAGAKVFAQRVVTGTTGTSGGFWNIAGASVPQAGKVRLYNSGGQTASDISVQIIWSL